MLRGERTYTFFFCLGNKLVIEFPICLGEIVFVKCNRMDARQAAFVLPDYSLTLSSYLLLASFYGSRHRENSGRT
jgi:hypothetical protein